MYQIIRIWSLATARAEVLREAAEKLETMRTEWTAKHLSTWREYAAGLCRIGRLRYSLVTSVKITPSLRSRLAASGGFR